MKMTPTEHAISIFKEMAGIKEPFGLFEPYLWADKIGDGLWHCEIRSVDAILAKGKAESMEDAIYKCYKDFERK